ncbi:MAG: hypothetical protein IKO68_02315 [Oscillospiraceae bacterium]|nr:hypothetical protein [Oscillospiraceae bacterium]
MKPTALREAFRAFPAVLQHQILLRFGLTLGAAASFGLFWLLSRQFWFGAPFAMLALWMGLSGVQMFRTVYRGKYTCVEASCKQVITTPILKRPKALILSTERGDLRLRMQQRIRKPEVNSVYDLYLADSAVIYQGDDCLIASSYLALARLR